MDLHFHFFEHFISFKSLQRNAHLGIFLFGRGQGRQVGLRRHHTVVLNGGSGGGYPKSGPKLNFNGSGAS